LCYDPRKPPEEKVLLGSEFNGVDMLAVAAVVVGFFLAHLMAVAGARPATPTPPSPEDDLDSLWRDDLAWPERMI
jgi:hypothetical protein